MIIKNPYGLTNISPFMASFHAFIHYPNDKNLMQQMAARHYLDFCLNQTDSDAKIPGNLYRLAIKHSEKDAATRHRHGMIAGRIFSNLLYLVETEKEPILNKAIYMLMEMDNPTIKQNGGKIITSESTTRDIWQKYRGVAHYWDASLIMLMAMKDQNNKHDAYTELAVFRHADSLHRKVLEGMKPEYRYSVCELDSFGGMSAVDQDQSAAEQIINRLEQTIVAYASKIYNRAENALNEYTAYYWSRNG